MYLFNRFRLHNGVDGPGATAAFVNAATVATEVTGLPVFSWHVSYHPKGNGFMTSARIETQAQLEQAWGKMMASAEMNDAIDAVTKAAPSMPVDNLARIVGGSLGRGPASIVRVTTAVAAPGRLRDAASWGAQMAVAGSASLDVPIAATMNVSGVYGGVALLASYESIEQLDQASEKLAIDESLQERIAETSELFVGDSAQMMLRRLN